MDLAFFFISRQFVKICYIKNCVRFICKKYRTLFTSMIIISLISYILIFYSNIINKYLVKMYFLLQYCWQNWKCYSFWTFQRIPVPKIIYFTFSKSLLSSRKHLAKHKKWAWNIYKSPNSHPHKYKSIRKYLASEILQNSNLWIFENNTREIVIKSYIG